LSATGEIILERNPHVTSVDFSKLHALIHRSFAYMDARIDPPSSLHRMGVDDLIHKARTETLIVARENNDVVGCMFCRDEGAFLYVGKIAVEPDKQGRSIGQMLFKSAFALAKQHGMMGLELETRIELSENHAYFERLGFSKVGETAHAGYPSPTAITMRAVTEPL